MKSRSSFLAPAHLGGPGKKAIKRLWYGGGGSSGDIQRSWKICFASDERRHCSNEGNKCNLFNFAGVLQTAKLISAVSGLKFTIL